MQRRERDLGCKERGVEAVVMSVEFLALARFLSLALSSVRLVFSFEQTHTHTHTPNTTHHSLTQTNKYTPPHISTTNNVHYIHAETHRCTYADSALPTFDLINQGLIE